MMIWLRWQALAGRSSLCRGLAPVLLALALLALGGVMRLPELLHNHGQAKAEHERLGLELETTAPRLLELVRVRKTLGEAQQQLQDARWQLAAGESMSDLLDQMAASGHTHGLVFEQLDVHLGVEHVGYRRTPLDVRVVGRYPALRQWLDDWLGQLRLLQVGEMKLARVDERPGLLRLSLRVHAFHADAPTPSPAYLAQMPARAEFVPAVNDPFATGTARMDRGGLARVPLAQLEMVGGLWRGVEHEALLLSAGRLYRVRTGARLGRDGGVVTRIDEQRVAVRERLFVAGTWRERTVFLILRKPVDRESIAQDEMAIDMGSDPADDAAGVGDALPG
ncbi:Pilus assembly protein, PilO [compost metagenome]